MQKVYIRGVKGRGAEVIAKLEALGGKNEYKYKGEDIFSIYVINIDNVICKISEQAFHTLALMWAGTEIFIDEPVEEQKSTNTLKKNDPVMISNNGEAWTIGLYKDDCVYLHFEEGNEDIPLEWKYIVPLADFNFNDLESNIKRSIV